MTTCRRPRRGRRPKILPSEIPPHDFTSRLHMIRIGVIGLGHWGPNLMRCFSALPDCRVTAVCDRNCDQLLRIRERYPQVQTAEGLDDLLDRDLVDAVVIATPTATHFELARKALEHDLHVFVEKPLATTSAECVALVDLAAQRNRLLFVGHVFLHSAPVAKLRQLITSGELGKLTYISSRRLNLGPVRRDVNALYDLAPHDISMILHLFGSQPESVSCQGLSRLHPGIEDVCNLTMLFGDNRMAMVHVSWLDPRKERVLTVVGDRKMVVYDDLEQEKLKVYDKGVDAPRPVDDFGEFQYSYRYGDSYCPWIEEHEPLKTECAEFIRCIQEGDVPLTDGVNGFHVTRVLEAAQQSLMRGGVPIRLVEQRYESAPK
ncbi:MAG: gfo/Idh/MocA family oxidoreductase [Planctomycetota bacterium]|nr:MAG: gfo/Idh/MocA family oxidoreductase [Planctomycetota bacterium]